MITLSVSTPNRDRVNAARAGARTLSAQTHQGWADDLPVGRRVAIASAVLRFVARNAADNARDSTAAVVNPNIVSERHFIHLVVWCPQAVWRSRNRPNRRPFRIVHRNVERAGMG